jgi:hypothetical protein
VSANRQKKGRGGDHALKVEPPNLHERKLYAHPTV